MADDVVLEVAERHHAGLLANLMELYLHDMSEAFDIEPGDDGRFGYEHLPLYWSEPEWRCPFLIRHDGRVAGFVLVTRASEAFDIAEFFVLRRHRRGGVGRRAAFLIWDRFPGRWTVRVAEANRAALAFWRGVIAEYSKGTATEEERPDWRVFSFTSH